MEKLGFIIAVTVILGVLTAIPPSQSLGAIEPSSAPDQMMVYRVIEPNVTLEVAEAWAGKLFNLAGEVVLHDETYYLTIGNRTFEMDQTSGAMWYADYSKLWNISYTPSLPPLDTCKFIADDFLTKNGLLPPNAFFTGFGSTNATAYNLQTEQTKSKLLNIQVNYGLELGNYSVGGPGAKIAVSIGDDGEIIGLNWAWRKIEPYDTFQTIDLETALSIAGDYTEEEHSLIYYAEPSDVKQDFLCPMYQVKIKARAAEQEYEYIRYIHATEFSPTVRITSPPSGSSFHKADPIFFNCTISSGTPPYTCTWESTLDGFLNNSQFFTTSNLSIGLRNGVVSGHSITVTVVDANGLKCENIVLVTITERPIVGIEIVIVAVTVVVIVAIIATLLVRRRKSKLLAVIFIPTIALSYTLLSMTNAYPYVADLKEADSVAFRNELSAYDDGTNEVGVEWLGYPYDVEISILGVTWKFTVLDLPNTKPDAKGFYNKLGGYGWDKEFNWGEEWAWEEDFKYDAIGGTDHIWVDYVDIAYFCGHGSPDGFLFTTMHDDTFLRYDEARWGDGDMEWMGLGACQCLRWENNAGDDVFDRWGSALKGVHMILGFHTICDDSDSRGRKWASYMRTWEIFGITIPGLTVKDAWFKACRKTDGSDHWAAVLYASTANDPWNPPLDDPSNDHLHGEGYVCSDPTPAQWWVWIPMQC